MVYSSARDTLDRWGFLMTAPLPPLPIGDRFKDTKQFRYLGAAAGDSLYECWQSAIEAFAKLVARQALERAAVCAWSTGMDEYAGTLGLSDARETGSKCATAIRAMIEEYK